MPLLHFHPQFSLRAAFALLTLVAAGTWYWYRLPFVVDETITAGSPPWMRSGSMMAPSFTYRVIRHERRLWGGKTRLHGAYLVYDDTGTLRMKGIYVDGQKHGEFMEYSDSGHILRHESFIAGQQQGPFRLWNDGGVLISDYNFDGDRVHGAFLDRRDSGELEIEGNYDHGIPEGTWKWHPWGNSGGTIIGRWQNGVADGLWEWRRANGDSYLLAEFRDARVMRLEGDHISPHLLETVVAWTADRDGVINDKFRDATLQYTNKPLSVLLEGQTFFFPRLRFDLRRMSAAGISPTVSITCNIEDEPCLIAFAKMLSPHGLGLDFRHGTFVVTTLDSIASWRDETGVADISVTPASDPELYFRFQNSIHENFIEKTLADVLAIFSQRLGLHLDLSRMPVSTQTESGPSLEAPVTMSFRGDNLIDALGFILDEFKCKISIHGAIMQIEPQ